MWLSSITRGELKVPSGSPVSIDVLFVCVEA